MALETGMDRKQLEAFKRLYARWTGDAVQFRFFVTVGLTLAIVGLVELPLGERLAAARTRLKEATVASALSHDVRGFAEQIDLYDPHVAVSTELVDWQGYVMAQLEHTSATLISLEPKGVEPKGVFQVMEMEIVAKGSSYREFVDFIARLEHGERLMRVEKLRLEKHQTTIFLTCQIKGLVKSSAATATAGKSAPTASAVYGPPFPFAKPGAGAAAASEPASDAGSDLPDGPAFDPASDPAVDAAASPDDVGAGPDGPPFDPTDSSEPPPGAAAAGDATADDAAADDATAGDATADDATAGDATADDASAGDADAAGEGSQDP